MPGSNTLIPLSNYAATTLAVTGISTALLVSPVVGFVCAALVFLLFKLVARDPRLYKAPEGTAPPPF